MARSLDLYAPSQLSQFVGQKGSKNLMVVTPEPVALARRARSEASWSRVLDDYTVHMQRSKAQTPEDIAKQTRNLTRSNDQVFIHLTGNLDHLWRARCEYHIPPVDRLLLELRGPVDLPASLILRRLCRTLAVILPARKHHDWALPFREIGVPMQVKIAPQARLVDMDTWDLADLFA